MKTISSWNRVDWKAAIDAAKRPFLFIRPAFGRYSLTQDEKKCTTCFLSGNCKSCHRRKK